MKSHVTERDCECLLSVQKFSSNGWPARLKEISSDLNVAGPTALGFLDSLMSKSLVEKGKTGYRLTDKGAEILREMYRSHRVFESLLFKLGVPLNDACEMSSRIDKVIDAKAVDALCSHLGHPSSCPHGYGIPDEKHGHHVRRGSSSID